MENNNDMLDILLSTLGNMSDSSNKGEKNKEPDSVDFSGIDLEKIMKLGDIMSSLNETDKDTQLLMALKPYLKEQNQTKIDTAVRLFKLISLLPAIKDMGLFDNLF